MKFLLFFSLIIVGNLGFSQSTNLSGKWVGSLIQDPNGEKHVYDMEMQLYHDGAMIKGTSKTSIATDSFKASGKLELKGSFYGDNLVFHETKVISEEINVTNRSWCIKTGKLKLYTTNNVQQLFGVFQGVDENGYNCAPGEILLVRQTNEAPVEVAPDTTLLKVIENEIPPEFEPESGKPLKLGNRSIKNGKTVPVFTSKISINIYDNQKLDGDIISLFYNDSWILQNYSIEDGNKNIMIDVNPRSKLNYLILYAHNLGSAPPNTIGVQFFNGQQEMKYILSSDLGESDILYFEYQSQ